MLRKSIYAAAFAMLCLSMPTGAEAQRLIVNQLSGKCLDVPGISNFTPGTPLQLFDCEVNGFDYSGRPSDQFWFFAQQGPIRNRLSGLCMDITGANPGAHIMINVCNGANPAQFWTFRPDGFIQNRATGLCIDVAGFPGVQTGTPLLLSPCEFGNPQTDQRWR